jgi:hypothetical protein
MPRTALFVTYAMSFPRAVVGVFFRALRLATELDQLGWRSVIAHVGFVPDDPKVRSRPPSVVLEPIRPGARADEAERLMRGYLETFAPDVVVFGEGPIGATQALFDAAYRLPVPFVLLDQYYSDWLLHRRPDIDLLLLYALRPFWSTGELNFERHYRLLPPFIERVTAAGDLPVPATVRGRPWVTVLGFDAAVLHVGVALAASAPADVAIVAISPRPDMAARLMAEHGVGADRAVALDLQSDADLFGAIAASRVTILANGYMQIMEALALGCPAICIDRGVGLPDWSLDERFKPYVSIGEAEDVQRRRLAEWLCASPFDPDFAGALSHERHGARHAAQLIDAVASRARLSIRSRLRQRRRMRGAQSARQA